MRKSLVIIVIIFVVIIFIGGLLVSLFIFGKAKEVSSIGVQGLTVTSEKVFLPQFLCRVEI